MKSKNKKVLEVDSEEEKPRQQTTKTKVTKILDVDVDDERPKAKTSKEASKGNPRGLRRKTRTCKLTPPRT